MDYPRLDLQHDVGYDKYLQYIWQYFVKHYSIAQDFYQIHGEVWNTVLHLFDLNNFKALIKFYIQRFHRNDITRDIELNLFSAHGANGLFKQ